MRRTQQALDRVGPEAPNGSMLDSLVAWQDTGWLERMKFCLGTCLHVYLCVHSCIFDDRVKEEVGTGPWGV
jgi:hypothetical protein